MRPAHQSPAAAAIATVQLILTSWAMISSGTRTTGAAITEGAFMVAALATVAILALTVQATTEVTPRLTQGLILILTQAIMATVQVVTEVPPHLIKGVIPILIKAATRPQAVATESTRIMPVMEATPTLGATLITEVILTMEAPTGASHNTQAGIRITEMATVAITDTVGAK